MHLLYIVKLSLDIVSIESTRYEQLYHCQVQVFENLKDSLSIIWFVFI